MRSWYPGVRGPAVLFVKAEWCPHCKTAKPEMETASAMLGDVIPMYAMDADKHSNAIQRLGIQGFPTILFLSPGGELQTYEGDRKGQNVADWACITSGLCGVGRKYRPM